MTAAKSYYFIFLSTSLAMARRLTTARRVRRTAPPSSTLTRSRPRNMPTSRPKKTGAAGNKTETETGSRRSSARTTATAKSQRWTPRSRRKIPKRNRNPLHRDRNFFRLRNAPRRTSCRRWSRTPTGRRRQRRRQRWRRRRRRWRRSMRRPGKRPSARIFCPAFPSRTMFQLFFRPDLSFSRKPPPSGLFRLVQNLIKSILGIKHESVFRDASLFGFVTVQVCASRVRT